MSESALGRVALAAIATVASACGVNRLSYPYRDSAEADVVCNRYRSAIDKTLREARYAMPDNKNAALYSLTLGTAALEYGDLALATSALRRATDTMMSLSAGRVRGSASVVLGENLKVFKGGIHEQELALLLQGIAYYQAGDIQTARASFQTAVLADNSSGVRELADDLAAGYYWLGRSLQRLGEGDNARIAFERLNRLMPGCVYCQPARALSDNLVVTVGLGPPPIRFPGASPSIDQYYAPPYDEAWCEVRIDGSSVGKCAVVFDAAQQIGGRDASTRHTIQTIKGVSLAAGSPFLENVTRGYWSKLGGNDMAKADLRAVPVFPGRLGLVSARLSPGDHTLEIVGMRMNGTVVESTRYVANHLAIPESGEVAIYVRIAPDRFRAESRSMACGTPNVLEYPDDDARFQSTYVRFWTQGEPQFRPATPSGDNRVRACLSGVQCPAGTKSVLLGGPDYRLPTAAVLAEWQSAGDFSGQTLLAIQAQYREKGFILPGDADVSVCGSHVAQGGRCLIPPAPGSPLFNQIVTGASE